MREASVNRRKHSARQTRGGGRRRGGPARTAPSWWMVKLPRAAVNKKTPFPQNHKIPRPQSEAPPSRPASAGQAFVGDGEVGPADAAVVLRQRPVRGPEGRVEPHGLFQPAHALPLLAAAQEEQAALQAQGGVAGRLN